VTRILIVDDDAAMREELRTIVGSDTEIQVVAEASNGREAVDSTLRHRPDVVLMDIRMPVVDGLTAAAQIRERIPTQAVIVLTTFGELDYVRAAIAMGLNGFLLKTGDPNDLLKGIRDVVRGGACLSPAIAAAVIADGRELARERTDAAQARAVLAALPAQEQAVLRLVAQGAPNAEIAARLHLSESTVKSYLSSSFDRLGVRNRVEAALFAWTAR
jgi:DNA-binding NarL/FixJ family response regulator